jgi:hypothetical protein
MLLEESATMEIMFDDLTEDAQRRLLKEANVNSPEEMDWDTIPVAEVKFDQGDQEDEEDYEDEEKLLEDDDDFEFDDEEY